MQVEIEVRFIIHSFSYSRIKVQVIGNIVGTESGLSPLMMMLFSHCHGQLLRCPTTNYHVFIHIFISLQPIRGKIIVYRVTLVMRNCDLDGTNSFDFTSLYLVFGGSQVLWMKFYFPIILGSVIVELDGPVTLV